MTIEESIIKLVEYINYETKNANVKRELELVSLKYVVKEMKYTQDCIIIDGLEILPVSLITVFSDGNIKLLNQYGWRVYECLDYNYEFRTEYNSYMIVPPNVEPQAGKDDIYGFWSEFKEVS